MGQDMAQITDMPPMFLRPVQIFDVTGKVGWGLHNSIEDVQLVQYAINKLAPKLGLLDFRKKTSSSGPGLNSYSHLAALTPDGKMGPETANAIASYQIYTHATPDNTVDPVYVLFDRLHGNPIGSNYIVARSLVERRMMYTLNTNYLAQFGRIMDENDFPPQLRAQIKRRLSPHTRVA